MRQHCNFAIEILSLGAHQMRDLGRAPTMIKVIILGLKGQEKSELCWPFHQNWLRSYHLLSVWYFITYHMEFTVTRYWCISSGKCSVCTALYPRFLKLMEEYFLFHLSNLQSLESFWQKVLFFQYIFKTYGLEMLFWSCLVWLTQLFKALQRQNGGKWQQITIYCSVSSFKGVSKNEKHEQRNKCKEMLNS